jgi:hypothetical protein
MQQTEFTREMWARFSTDYPVTYVPDRDAGPIDCTEPSCPVDGATFFEALIVANMTSDLDKMPRCYALTGCRGSLGKGVLCDSIALSNASLYECHGYRLPTEAEWEYAARAGTTTTFTQGNAPITLTGGCVGIDLLDRYAWDCANSEFTSHLVASKLPNGWGLFDMTGNALEWVDGAFTPNGYGTTPLTDPYFAPIQGSEYERFRVARGGNVVSPPAGLRNANRLFGTIDDPDGFGFRLAKTIF